MRPHAFAIFVLLLLLPVAHLFAEEPKWAIAIHGGAGKIDRNMSAEKKEAFKKALADALNVGKKILAEGGTSLDAVEATVNELEDCPFFNAGKGATYNREGMHELDASIMDGSNLKCGAVAMVKRIKNPISAARLVMEKTPHVLLCGSKADDFAKANGCERVSQSYFFTERRFKGLNRKRKKLGLKPLDGPGYDLPKEIKLEEAGSDELKTDESGGSTVGCVALDQHGNLAAATSTGGMTAKLGGRVGDSPIIGAGTYANAVVAVSGTGVGEQYIRHSIAARVAMLMELADLSVDEAVDRCLTKVLVPADGGLIAVDKQGNISLQASTEAMARGAADSTGRFETKLWMDEN